MVRRGSEWSGVAQVMGRRGSVMVRRGSVMVRRDSVMVRRGSVMVRRGSVMVRRGLVMVRRGSVWCGMAHIGAVWLSTVQRGSVGSVPACCRAGLSSILGSAPQRRIFPLS